MEGASKVTLYAIDGRGYAESVRLCLAACRVAYEEVAVTTRAQLDALPTPLPKQLPLLVVEFEGARPAEGGDGSFRQAVRVASAPAIIRHLARTFALYGESEAEAARRDTLSEGVVTRCAKFVALPFSSVPLHSLHGGEDWEDPVTELRARWLGLYLPAFERALRDNGCTEGFGYLVGKHMSYADLLLLEVEEYCEEYCPGALEEYVLLRSHWQRMRGKRQLREFFDGTDGHRHPPSGREFVAAVREVMS